MSELKQIEITQLKMFVLAKLMCTELDEQHTTNMQEKDQEAIEQAPELSIILEMSEVQFLPSLSSAQSHNSCTQDYRLQRHAT